VAQARRYDSRTTTFSPEGRLYQVEYAMEAISHAGICVGILAKDGIVLAVEKKITSKLLENISSEKMYKVLLLPSPFLLIEFFCEFSTLCSKTYAGHIAEKAFASRL